MKGLEVSGSVKVFCALFALSFLLCASLSSADIMEPAGSALNAASNEASLEGPPIATGVPFSPTELGKRAQAIYKGDGLSVRPTEKGALLRCDLQKLEAELTPDGLKVISTAPSRKGTFSLRVAGVTGNLKLS